MKEQSSEFNADFFQPFPELSTDRFVLREITEDDAGSLFEIFANPDVIKYWSHPPYESIDQARELIEKIRAGVAGGGAIEWGIAPRGDPRRLLGKCGFHQWHKRHYRAEIGYSLGRSSWGQGIMREALPRILAFGFERMRLHSVEAQVDPDNARSIRALSGLGFVKEGHFKENYFVNGRFFDTAVYSLLRTPG
jgi:ribosomal-protein-alanine N-acetyltransferase